MTGSSPLHRLFAAAVVTGSLALPLAPSAAANDTVAVKNALYGAGYPINNVSPQMDDATRKALEEFQSDAGLTASGVLDDATKAALGMVSVEVAAAPTTDIAANPGAMSGASDSAPAASQAESGGVKEGEDGGWSFF